VSDGNQLGANSIKKGDAVEYDVSGIKRLRLRRVIRRTAAAKIV
jgi:hypothetical protein